jgi:hypothetical protein
MPYEEMLDPFLNDEGEEETPAETEELGTDEDEIDEISDADL